jgi:hypothetical protein
VAKENRSDDNHKPTIHQKNDHEEQKTSPHSANGHLKSVNQVKDGRLEDSNDQISSSTTNNSELHEPNYSLARWMKEGKDERPWNALQVDLSRELPPTPLDMEDILRGVTGGNWYAGLEDVWK